MSYSLKAGGHLTDVTTNTDLAVGFCGIQAQLLHENKFGNWWLGGEGAKGHNKYSLPSRIST